MALQRAAVIDGPGIAMTFAGFYADLLAWAAVEGILSEWSEPFSGPFLFYAQRRHIPAPLRALIEFIKTDQVASPA